ncbi:hypothetical protein I203_101993 [Kwoniella mangroviensis CBS 8507]|uniref:uncharacterized protein n=1 Tax=Kwoniella mangroviensis CBS 8507 TaxID=1296122 RepID=UPI00080D639E|nr:uncharacterized protein I203_03189 [Kwoniella mangroviensis CBS 8507]OCF67492.1 hypothetical protein I203_03189 [Kwoniella mangroviensis CBS 8507]
MLESSEDALRFLAEGQTLLGEGWTHVDNFDELDEDEFEEEEEEIYVTMDLGTTLDAKALQNENQYQLVGLDTPLPFLKLGNQIFQGQTTPLIGDEVVLGLIRHSDNPHEPTHPPLYSTNHRLTFRAITLEPRSQPQAQTQDEQTTQAETEPGPSSSSFNLFSNSPMDSPTISGPPVGSLKKGRSKGAGQVRPRFVIDKPEDLENFDVKAMKTSQKVELGPNVLRSLGLPPSTHGENVLLSKTDLSQVISGYSSRSQASQNRKKGRIWGVDKDGKIALIDNDHQGKEKDESQEVGVPGDVQMEEGEQNNLSQENNVGSSAQTDEIPPTQSARTDQDQVMGDVEVEDDPPWAEVENGQVHQ